MPRFVVACSRAGLLCFSFACGEAPDPPGPQQTSPLGDGAGGSKTQEVFDSLPPRDETGGSSSEATDDPGSVDAGAAGNDSGEVVAPNDSGFSFAACTESIITGCQYLHITAQDREGELCVQLSLDNCSDNGSGIGADVPRTWRLGSGSVTRQGRCELDVYYRTSVSITSATGSLSWDLEAPTPRDVVIALTLQTSRVSENAPLVPETITLESDALTGQLSPCDG